MYTQSGSAPKGTDTATTSSQMGSSVNMSSMIQQEMKAIEKMKFKQKKEIEQMIDYEMKMNEIRARNEHNIKLQ